MCPIVDNNRYGRLIVVITKCDHKLGSAFEM